MNPRRDDGKLNVDKLLEALGVGCIYEYQKDLINYVINKCDSNLTLYHEHREYEHGLTELLHSDDFKILDDISHVTTYATYTQSMLENDISALKKRIKHAKNPLEKKRYEQLLNKAYKKKKETI